ncbi:hypothetical protein [Oryzifoliimicrobium ureilyticus]|uniref:hypothetical protein n=1 Tax=Oryzifoliimicrobium ureilyticus TaxID=3113724 RepID=UPI00307644EF
MTGPSIAPIFSPDRKPLPQAAILAEQLLTQSLREVAALYGVTPSAVCVRLRRAGMARGKPKPRRAKGAQLAAPAPQPRPLRPGQIRRVTRITEIGAAVSVAWVSILDG